MSTNHFCDDCGDEIEGASSWSVREEPEKDLCQDCYQRRVETAKHVDQDSKEKR